MKSVTIALDDEIAATISALAKSSQTPIEQVLNSLILVGLDHEVDNTPFSPSLEELDAMDRAEADIAAGRGLLHADVIANARRLLKNA